MYQHKASYYCHVHEAGVWGPASPPEYP